MKERIETRFAVSAREAKGYTTAELRDAFVMEGLFQKGELNLVYTHYDRMVVGGAVPAGGTITLDAPDIFKSEFFLERRELGIINIGAEGKVVVDGEAFTLGNKEALYVGQGHRDVSFEGTGGQEPPHFYLCSAPAHAAYPTTKIASSDVEPIELGSAETANARLLRKLIVNERLQTCQLQMGMTTLKPGSVWNTMPAHTHDRRMEVYLYFEVPEDQAVAHLIGEPEESRFIWLHNEDAVLSPPWSMHAGAGTSSYSFIWAMAGENLNYGDMDVVDIRTLR